MDLDTTDHLHSFQEFRALIEFWLEDYNINKKDQYHKIVYPLEPKTKRYGSTSSGKITQMKKTQLKVFNKFEGSFQPPNIKWSYSKEA